MTSLPPPSPGTASRPAGSRVLHRLRRVAVGPLLAAFAIPLASGAEIIVAAGGSLSSAVTSAASDDIITIQGQINSGQVTIPVDKNNLTFRSSTAGVPVTIQANAGSRIFSIPQGNSYTFNDIIFRGPGSASTGSAISVAGTGGQTTTLAGSFTVTNFTGSGGQGAIANTVANSILVLGSAGGTVTVTDNSGTNVGGGVRAVNLTLAGNAVFENNESTTNNGGAIFVDANATFEGTATFRNNRSIGDSNAAGRYGGAIQANGAGSAVVFRENALFDSNLTTHGNGGAIRSNGSLTFDKDVVAINNSASRNTTTNASLSVNGGAFYATSALTITGAITAENNSTVTSGGALHVNAGDASIGNNALFRANTAQLNNGGAINVAGTGNITVGSGATFANNSAGNTGGAVNAGGNGSFGNGANFTQNTAVNNNGGAVAVTGNLTFGSANFVGNTAGNSGGAVYTQGNLTVGPGEFRNNSAGTNGGAIYFGTSASATANTTLRLDASAGSILFSGNTANNDTTATPNAIFLSQGLTGNATLTQRLELVTGAGQSISFFDPIASKSDADSNPLALVEKTGAGTVLFDTHASNIYAHTTVAGGTFQVGNGATYGASSTVGSLTVQSGATLSGNGTFRANDVTVASGATLRATDGGTLSLNATNRSIGSVALAGHGTIAAGTALNAANITAEGALVLNDATTLAAGGTIAGTTANASLDSAAPITLAGNATVTAGAGQSLTVFSQLEGGSAALTKTGAGTVTLASPNDYSGGTTVSAGNLIATSTVALGTGNIANNATLTLANGGTDNLSVAVSGTGDLVKTGTGNLLLSGANTYTGATTITQGTLTVDSAAAATGLAASSGVTLATGGTLALNGHDLTLAGLSGTGGTVALGGADLAINAAGNSTYAGNLTGTATSSITKSGTGTLTLSSTAPLAPGFAGDVAVNAGTLAVTGGALTTTGNFTVASGSTLGLAAGTASITAGQVTLQNNSAIDIVGYSASTLGAVDLITGTAPISADLGQISLLFEGQLVGAPSLDQYLTLQLQSAAAGTKIQLFSGLAWETSSSAHGTFNISSGSTFTTPTALADNTTFSSTLGGWDGRTLTKSGDGTLVLGHVNTYTGATNVQGGTLQFGAANAIAASSAVTLASGTTLDLAGHNQALNNLAGAGNITLGSATLTAQGAANTTLAGTISGTGSVVKQGTGTLTLSGANTYSGGTTVSGGTLVATSAAALGTGNLVNNSSVEFATTGNGTFAGSISGPGTLAKSGAGALTLTGATGAASSLAVNGGTLALGNGTAAHAFTAGTASVAANSTLTVDRNSTLNVTGALNLANNSTLNLVVGTPSPIVSASTMTIGNTATTLNVTGITGNTAMPFTLISTTGGISGAFTAVNVGGGSSSTDYLQLSALKSANGNDYVLNMALTWLTPGATASGTFTLGQGESFDVGVVLADQAANATWDGRSITKAGAGTLILSAVNTYTGATHVQTGTLRLGTANAIATSNAVNVASGATLDLAGNNQTLNQLAGAGNVTLGSAVLTAANSANSTFSGVISGTGSLVKQGTAALTLTGANTYSGGTTISAGRLVAGSTGALGTGTVNVGSSGTLEFTTTGTVANALAGTGALIKANAGTLNLTGNSTAFTGTTTVSAGTLAVNGSLRGTLTIGNGARLQGTGSVGTTTIASGGTLAPGNSIGTTNVSGNLTFATGSTYEVEISPTAADRTNVTGSVTIQNGTTVNVLKETGTYANGTRFTILSATGGISGQFTNLTQNLPFLDMFLEYATNDVFLNLSRNTVAFDTYARTRNEQATARGIEALGSQNDLYNAIVALPDEAAVRSAYNSVSGELHATLQTALLDNARLVRESSLRRGLPFSPDVSKHPYWVEVVGSNAKLDGDGNAAETESQTFGVLAGRDFAVGDATRAGFVVGFTSTSVEPVSSRSELDITSVHVGAYANMNLEQIALRGGATATRHTVESSRGINVGTTDQTLTTRRIATSAQVFGEAGYLFGDRHSGFEPFVGGHVAVIDAEAFREIGGSFALRGRSARKGNQAGTAGIRGHFGGAENSKLSLGGTIAWQRNFGDLDAEQKLAFIDGPDFLVQGLPLSREYLVTELNLGLNVSPRTRLTFGYSGRHASNATDHAVRGVFSLRF